MNTIRVIDFLLDFLPEPTGDIAVVAQNHLRSLVAQYDALAPDWTQAPYWAQWYAIDANGDAYWYADEPSPQSRMAWDVKAKFQNAQSRIDLPIGIDWRTCKWQRPEVAG